jgi:hypothetical protein
LTLQTPKPEIAPLDEIDGDEPPSIQWSWLYWDFGNQEFEMKRPKPLVTPFPKLRNFSFGEINDHDRFAIS